MSYHSDLTDEQWTLPEPVFNAAGKRGRKHADDLRGVVDAMLYISQTGCQWRYLPESFGPWTRVWSQFRRWSRNGTWARALTALHAAAREANGRPDATPSMVVIDTHLARGASNGGASFHDRGGPWIDSRTGIGRPCPTDYPARAPRWEAAPREGMLYASLDPCPVRPMLRRNCAAAEASTSARQGIVVQDGRYGCLNS
jgi:transposase